LIFPPFKVVSEISLGHALAQGALHPTPNPAQLLNPWPRATFAKEGNSEDR